MPLHWREKPHARAQSLLAVSRTALQVPSAGGQGFIIRMSKREIKMDSSQFSTSAMEQHQPPELSGEMGY